MSNNNQTNNQQNSSAQNQSQVNTQVTQPVENQTQQIPSDFEVLQKSLQGRLLQIFGRIFGKHSMKILLIGFSVFLAFFVVLYVIPSMKPGIEFYLGEDKQEQTIKEQKEQAKKQDEQIIKLEDEVIKANQTISDLQKENQKLEDEKDALQDDLLKLTQESQSKQSP